MTEQVHKPETPTWKKALNGTKDGALVYLQSKASLFGDAELLGEASRLGKKSWKAVPVFFLLHLDVSRGVIGAVKGMNGGSLEDQPALDHLDKWVAVLTDCGTPLVFALMSPLSGGLTAGIAVLQLAGCAKSVMELVAALKGEKPIFERSAGWRWFGLGLDTLSLLGQVFGLGAAALEKAGAKITLGGVARAFTGGGPRAGLADRVVAGAAATALGLKGVGVVLEEDPTGKIEERPADRARVEDVLDRAGLGFCPFPWPLQPSLCGPFPPGDRRSWYSP